MSTKNIVITGVSSGIGKALVNEFLQEGHRVVGISSNAKKLETAFQDLPSQENFISICFDLAKLDQYHLLAQQIPFSQVDILINNAGLLINKPFEAIQPEDYIKSFQVNGMAPYFLTQVLYSKLKASEKAHVVNISSMGAYQSSVKFPGLSIYASSKAAMSCATECLATELKDSGIRFNVLALGAVQTEMLENAFPGYIAPVNSKQMAIFIKNFALQASEVMNGQVTAVSLSTP